MNRNQRTSLNYLNLSLYTADLLKHEDKIRAFMKKITHWKVRDSQERLRICSCLTEIILSQENFDESAIQVSLKSTISSPRPWTFSRGYHRSFFVWCK